MKSDVVVFIYLRRVKLQASTWCFISRRVVKNAAHATVANGKLACGKLIQRDTEKLLTDQHLYVKTNISIILLGLAKQPYH
jgi:hypothetical protein